MKFAHVLFVPALLVSGAAVAQTSDTSYKAVGTEPGWALTIDKGLIRYVGDYGRTRVTAQAPVPRPSFNGLRYVTPRITIDITRSRCSDGMSNRDYPDSVTVTVGRRTVRGCGGEPIVSPPRAAVIEGKWEIQSIEGRPVRGPRPATIAFAGDRISGNSGCNSFGGSFRFERGYLTAGPLMSTKMACMGPAMAQEQAIMRLLGERLSASTNRDGKLVLSASGLRTLVLVRSGPAPR
ncbi:MAG: META domain-containing protein [Candidatus Sphingomonas phytovorans]|nr:META domain-containing protein [Sphingomonas sp.]WEK01376.1 MAG: META domain-containing protein [Sphingomonas sp.]